MKYPPRFALALTLAALVAAGSTVSDAQTAARDPVARGLDVFVHVPDRAAPGGFVPVQVEALGFPSVISLVPLGGAAIEAAWDPEHLGPGVSAAPAPVRAITDASGKARLAVPVPDGDERDLRLLVGVRSGGHDRTRTVHVKRGPLHAVALHVADTRVVPGSAISAWVLVTNASTGEPVGRAPIEVSLLEGGVPRHRVELTTDAAGTAMARVPIPAVDEPAWSWKLRARSLGAGERGAGQAESTLTPREETPGSPRLVARWDEGAVLAGDRATFTARVRDATDLPIAGLPITYWIGPKGTDPPKDDKEWEKVAQSAVTDAGGEIHGAFAAPSTVVQGVGTTLRLLAKTNVEGHALEHGDTANVGAKTAHASLSPEAGSIVPGVEQRMLLTVGDGRGEAIAATFKLEADGLAATVTTNADGEAEVTWHPPADVGAMRRVGPCAGGVAAAVVVRAVGDVPALKPRKEPFELCVPVDRDAGAMVRFDRPIARIGDRVRVRVVMPGSPDARAGATSKRAWSVVMRSPNGEQAASAWLEDGEAGAEIEVPPGAPGQWSISAVSPGIARASRVAAASLLVTPRVLPALAGRVVAGRAAPGGSVEIEASLGDGHGAGLQGTVSAAVVDLHGGGSVAGLDGLDTRRSLCGALGVGRERCDRFVEGDAALDPLRRGRLGDRRADALAPANDPGGSAKEELSRAFADVLRSLEGAVFEATQSADQLRDVRRKSGNGWTFNPELMTLVTAAMGTPPLTPGGEPLALGDLIAVDSQVTFNNVARRITRLKLFRVLAAVRNFRREHQLDADEPIFKNPNALLRRLVREGKLTDDMLLDPWGGTLQFAKASGPPTPFLSVVRGFELRAPGPDGTLGNGDDVKDPFERVVRSGTPYAKAMQEDRIVDAKFDMEIADSTVFAWQTLFDELTGTALGQGGGLSLHGIGEGGGGTGSGVGFGHGRGSIGRSSRGIATGVAFWSPPQRTDANGKVRIQVPLGDAETTWRVALIGVPDGGRPATSHVDVPVALPLSARVDAGAAWVEGDVVHAAITLRNRTAKAIRATIAAAAGGVARLAGAAERALEVPAGGAAVATVEVRAAAAGTANLAVTVRAPGLPDDVVRHAWEVLPAGELTALTRAQWVEGSALLEVPLGGDGDRAAPFMRVWGEPRLVLERGFDGALRAALDALDPDKLASPDALADAIEVGARLERWATAKEGEGSAAAVRAREIARRARGRLAVYRAGSESSWWVAEARMRSFTAPEPGAKKKPPECPPASRAEGRLAALDAEPPPASGAALACWDAAVSEALEEVERSGDATQIARAVLALAERPHRAASAEALIDRLREKIALRPSGAITLPAHQAKSRAARAIVFAALLRGARLGKPSAAPAHRLAAWIGVQRDADGGYGSSLATRAVVRALLATELEEKGIAKVTVGSGASRREIDVGPSARVVVPLAAGTIKVELDAQGAGTVARFERPAVRLWSHPPDEIESPLHVDVTWPKEPRRGTTGVLRIAVRHSLGRSAAVDVRVPLPPSVALAEPVKGVRQIQGALAIRRTLDASELPTTIEVPVRFGLAGQVTAPEARATIALEEIPRAVAPARALVIR